MHDLPKRKNIRLKDYDYSQNNAYFVTICTQNRQCLFGADVGSPLQQIIGWFKTMTTNEYIRGVKSGICDSFEKRIWQQSYYDRIIHNEFEYKEIWQYIDTNPIKWQGDDYFI